VVEELKYRLAQQLADVLNAIDEVYELKFRLGSRGDDPELVLCERGRVEGWVTVAAVIDLEDEDAAARWAVMRYT
jgi:hypothetical protein